MLPLKRQLPGPPRSRSRASRSLASPFLLVPLLIVLFAACDARDARPPAPEPPPAHALVHTATHAAPLNAAGELLDEAFELFLRARAGRLRRATDPMEGNAGLIGANAVRQLAEREDYETLFNAGDEAFEAEPDRRHGAGRGPAPPADEPARPQRVIDGDLGGFDASSCRSCHFVGGADGSGAFSQAALFRGDGRHLSSASVRVAPHVMGLGYVARAAREIEAGLHRQRAFALDDAREIGEPVRVSLRADGLTFGHLTAHPDGTLDTREVRHVSPDLVIRPFGHKGRHPTLEDLCDDALFAHHGVQSTGRVARFADRAATHLGPGPAHDPDDDGVAFEASEGQAVLLAAYLAMIGTPVIRPPADPLLADAWARGWALFHEVGCADCHRPVTYLRETHTTLHAWPVDAPWSIELPLAEVGLEPRPRQLEQGPGPDGLGPPGLPLFLFSDLRRHDLGPELAEPVDEPLPDGDLVPGSVWLTRPLWGLADTAPYLHDGRALTLHEAIEWHGGDAADARGAYRALAPPDQGALRVFLTSLTRETSLVID